MNKKFKNKIITLEDIMNVYKLSDYKELYALVIKCVRDNKLEPVKSSGGNGKNPKLFKRYRILNEEKDYDAFYEEINYVLSSKLNVSYYKRNINKYIEHREYILKLNDFIKKKEKLLNTPISMNERSFQIWGREKFIQKEEGRLILKNLGLNEEYLNFYDTSEPLAYYSKSKKDRQNILILENKDTYYTIRKFLISSNKSVFGVDIDTIIYGGGKGIIKAFKDYKISVEDYLYNKENNIYYFGDLDYEGILIYESFFDRYCKEYKIRPFVNGYMKMIDNYYIYLSDLPATKDGQNRNINGSFIDNFSKEYKNKILEILQNNLYIPQESINIYDLEMEEK